jgi:hypothetical protein
MGSRRFFCGSLVLAPLVNRQTWGRHGFDGGYWIAGCMPSPIDSLIRWNTLTANTQLALAA